MHRSNGCTPRIIEFGTITFDHYDQREHLPLDASFPVISSIYDNGQVDDERIIPGFLRDIVGYPLLFQYKRINLSLAIPNRPIIVQYHYVLQSIAERYRMKDFHCRMSVRAFTTNGIELTIPNSHGNDHMFLQIFHDQRLSPNTLELPFLTNRQQQSFDRFWLVMKPNQMFHENSYVPITELLNTMILYIEID